MGREGSEVSVKIAEALHPLWSLWHKERYLFARRPLFVTPPWLDAWKRTLGQNESLCLLMAYGAFGADGYLALKLCDTEGLFAGDPEVCDYFDVVIRPGREEAVWRAMLQSAGQAGLKTLNLFPVRPTSTVMTHGVPLGRALGYAVSVESIDVTVEMPLAPSWEGYLQSLNGKQRHEVRRKMRRLEEAGQVDYRVVSTPSELEQALEVFFHLFQSNRDDKARFLTPAIRTYMETLCHTMGREGLLRLSFLHLNGSPAASALCFDDGETVYLYNNGYDAAFAPLSVGLMQTLFTIKDAAERGRTRYEFLRGDETYKFRLGGQEVPLYRVHISLDAA
ncbi:GNAT family N-acetyltransferase [Desulfosoma caldarium]|uniref:CelD/BcsL family acetyltransferase involved in cellulose biosynthesis n=1 Tax=Desulfosoma caldarium TaxID=610254 RepID=A0A3N1VRM5_9BACT|nr:GNAT family N-acetyltransferase [Desulfosoma caldarium]ROR02902.1 CelD/BcsL family acetyltransferase involved in cellulose biosynthesis [Desulfosoma caldarium]